MSLRILTKVSVDISQQQATVTTEINATLCTQNQPMHRAFIITAIPKTLSLAEILLYMDTVNMRARDVNTITTCQQKLLRLR